MDLTDIVLSDRKKLILKSVIREYVKSGEAMGSSTIVQRFLPNVSSATIRNELAELEKLGFLDHPHTSAGRVPTDLGYRYFVDNLMEKRRLEAFEMIEIQNAMQQPLTKFDNILRDVADVLANLTGAMAVSLSPKVSRNKIKSIKLVRLDSFNLVLIVFAEGDIVKHNHIKLDFAVDKEFVLSVSTALNREFSGLRMEEIEEENFVRIMLNFRSTPELIGKILRLIIRAVEESAEMSVNISGTEHIFDIPELQNLTEAKEIFSVLSNGSELKKIISPKISGDNTAVIIGNECGDDRLSAMSITACKQFKNGNGCIAVVAPIRCDYERIISCLDYASKHLERLIGADSDKQLIIRRNGVFSYGR